MKEKLSLDNDCLDLSEEYFRKKDKSNEIEIEEYFPNETLKPPHY